MQQLKKELRQEFRLRRKSLRNKSELDLKIQSNFLNSSLYENSSKILCYCSLQDEIETDHIIKTALNDGKCVAVPYCVDNDGNMEFYIISDFSDLTVGSFNVREPNVDRCTRFTDFNDCVIVVPAFCFDKNGFRLGYGKGFYDRFLQKHSLISVGLCYNSNIVETLPTDKYDKSVDYIITQNEILETK